MGVAKHRGIRPNPYDRESLAAGEQPVSRRRFLSLSLTASAGLMLLGGTGCRRATRRGLREGERERTGGEGGVEDRDRRRRRPVRGGGLRRLLRRLF